MRVTNHWKTIILKTSNIKHPVLRQHKLSRVPDVVYTRTKRKSTNCIKLKSSHFLHTKQNIWKYLGYYNIYIYIYFENDTLTHSIVVLSLLLLDKGEWKESERRVKEVILWPFISPGMGRDDFLLVVVGRLPKRTMLVFLYCANEQN